MNETASTILALIIAPALPAVGGALGTPIVGGQINTDVPSVVGLAVAFYPFSFVAALLGLPLFLLLRRLNLVRWWSALTAGSAVGALVVIVLSLPDAPRLADFRFLTPLGAVSGVLFWAIWRLGNHSRQQDGQ